MSCNFLIQLHTYCVQFVCSMELAHIVSVFPMALLSSLFFKHINKSVGLSDDGTAGGIL